ncbi:MAG: NAD(P)-dependent oxidoreductase [Verrucomicrobia bacterium]|nr:NAD(P)-dependent oxidoreductase [Verrucomicrobiota bacterium]
MMESLLVTGATGFVGRNLLTSAVRERVPVLAPVRSPEKLFRCMEQDGIPRTAVTPLPTDPAEWPALSPTHAVLGAGVLFARTRNEYFETNVDWTMRVLRALPPGCRTVVLSSQSAGGPTPNGRAARSEQDPDSPVTWYGESKLALERAIARELPDRPITILRPPMILGARDTATLPLFKMARGLVRTKPGLRRKEFSYLAVEDVVGAIHAAFELGEPGPFYIGSDRPVSDYELISSAARAVEGNGITLPVPLPLVRLMAAVVDAIPALRAATPSLTCDRAREIWPDRWVVDPSAFRRLSGWTPSIPLDEALLSACRYFQDRGSL